MGFNASLAIAACLSQNSQYEPCHRASLFLGSLAKDSLADVAVACLTSPVLEILAVSGRFSHARQGSWRLTS